MAALVSVAWVFGASAVRSETDRPPFCAGAYADDFSSLSAQSSNYDDHPEAAFSYCARNAAVYECLSYAADGTIRRDRKRIVIHGTAFAYRRQGSDTLLLTNDHVAAWPSVTDATHSVDGVPSGCKLVSQALSLVDNEHDEYPRDDLSATVVVTDPQLDVAILKVRADLQVMRWKVGRSSDLRERNIVEVRGFPLGAFRATNVGKVISAHDHDDYGDWNHDDFVIDALLSSGNSGSPVLAVSCATGEYELVGIFHAGYTGGSALNVVVGIDQVRDLMTTLKRSPRDHEDDLVLDTAARKTIGAALGPLTEIFFPFGGLVGNIRARPDGAFLFALFPKDFPSASDPLLVVEDGLSLRPNDFGSPGEVWVGSPRGLKAYQWLSFPPEVQAQLAHVRDDMASDVLSYLALQKAREMEPQSRQSTDRLLRMGKAFVRTTASRADLTHEVVDIAESFAPQAGGEIVHYSQLIASPARAQDETPAAPPRSPARPVEVAQTGARAASSPGVTGGIPMPSGAPIGHEPRR